MAKTQTIEEFREWFRRTGYPVEMRIARETLLHASHAFVAHHVPLAERPPPRRPLEIDVLGGMRIADVAIPTEYRFAIECKGFDEAFCAIAPPHVPAFDHPPTPTEPRQVLVTSAMRAAIEIGGLYDIADHDAEVVAATATAGKGATSAAIDALYDACEKADAFAQSVEAFGAPPRAAIVIPVLVWRSPIYWARLDDNGEVAIEEVLTALVSWTGFNGDSIDVFVVRESEYGAWMGRATHRMYDALPKLKTAVTDLSARLAKSDDPGDSPMLKRLRARLRNAEIESMLSNMSMSAKPTAVRPTRLRAPTTW
jgi:hypothetical protein